MLPIFQRPKSLFFFFFNDTATTEIYTLSLHDALPISIPRARLPDVANGCDRIHDATRQCLWRPLGRTQEVGLDRKSTRLNSSHLGISYAVFCLKKKNTTVSGVHDRIDDTTGRVVFKGI